MKGRSNRLPPTSDPPDDWVDGSWTVDCICGVNFDDGEEMVNCDECGVWVHTRCSRYVKGEKSFACDKCKNKSSRNNSEETEVAQLLVELPTKTIKMSNSNNNHPGPLSSRPPWRPYRLWTERPIDVHVQGVPGGDPSLFQGLSSIFTSELWKCSGYVPKKFNFRYREFPCWEKQQDVETKADGDTENLINRGAGVLYSLSKETFGPSRTPDLVTMKGQVKVGGSDKKSSKERKWEGGDVNNTVQNSAKKEKLHSPVVHCGKRSREDSGPSKDPSVKKKNRTVQKEHEKRDKGHAIKTVVIRSTNARQVEVGDSKAHRVLGYDAIDDKQEDGKNAGSQELASTAQVSAGGCIEKPKRNAVTNEENLTPRSCEVSGSGYSRHKRVRTEKLSHDASDSAKSEELPLPSQGKDTITKNIVKKEGLLHDSNRNSGVQLEILTGDLPKAKPLVEVVVNSALEVQDTEVLKNLDTTTQLSSTFCDNKTKSGAVADDAKEALRSHASEIVANTDFMKDLVVQVQSAYCESENFEVNEAGPTTSHSHNHEGRDAGKDLELVSDCQFQKDEKIIDDSCDNKLQYLEPEGSMLITKVSLDSKEVPKGAGDTKKLVEAIPRSPPPSQHKMVSAGKSSSSSSTIVISKYSFSDRNKTGNSQSASPIPKEVISSSSMAIKKESEAVDKVKGQGKHEKPKSTPKASPKSLVNSVLKASQTSRAASSPFSKHYTSVGKDSPRHLSSKPFSVENSLHPSSTSEPASLQTQHPAPGPSKNIATSGQHRGEKAPQSNSQSTSKLAQTTSGHLPASNTPAGLSDEELALLLHQELNSSPRVPRVPRVRHTGSLPQLSSATPTSMLIKRTSSSGGKEQYTFSRRKSKDVHKDGSRTSLDRDIEARKGDRVPSHSDSAKPSDALPPVAANPESLHSARKNVEHLSTPAASSAASSVEANELKTSSMPDSSGNIPDDDTDIKKVLGPTHRTLPGLISEIMGKGRRMTYDELCNAVLPHWQNLRKHNGERYAYSSHSQAVLDCLRNRTEWAQLVDRGPKTNASRKKRKMDPEAESEDGEGRIRKEGEGRSLESTKEEFPKRRRNARKGILRGRSINEGRRKIETGSDHTASFSDSGEESASSEDGSQASGMCTTARSGASASSDEIPASVS